LPSSQLTGVLTQLPLDATQVERVQTSGAGQTTGGKEQVALPVQTSLVHRLPSLQTGAEGARH